MKYNDRKVSLIEKRLGINMDKLDKPSKGIDDHPDVLEREAAAKARMDLHDKLKALQ